LRKVLGEVEVEESRGEKEEKVGRGGRTSVDG
jgi:hypothetical protein